MTQKRKSSGRRGFLVGLLTGAGAAAALVGVGKKATETKAPRQEASAAEPVLYRRTEETERYYRTLYT